MVIAEFTLVPVGKGDIRKGSKWRMDRKVKVVEGLLTKGR